MRPLILCAVAALTFAIMGGCQSAPRQEASPPAATAAPTLTPVQRGEYLARIMGCNDCHTTMQLGPQGPIYDQAKYLAGHPSELALPAPPATDGPWWMASNMTAFAGPWGISYAANITPDSLTGIGIWTEEIFIKAMRTGRHAGVARPILPPMPWPSVAALTDDDIRALYAYLRSVPPVHNEVPQPVLNAPPEGAGAAPAGH